MGRLVGGTVLGSVLVVAGLLTAYLTIATSLVSTLVPDVPSGGGRVGIGLGVWSFALIAGGALLVAGTSRLAIILMMLRTGHDDGGPAARALVSTPDDVAVASGVTPREGRPIPELVIGAFGAAVVHELSSSRQIRHGRAGWESRTSDGWQPMEDPLDAAMRDAERVRRWLSTADLDFVVRVYAALVVSDRTLQRSPTCAVISAEQIPAWIASLPRQRTLTAGRRGRLLAMARSAASAEAGSRERSW
ncbi:MAG: hypothetical protein Q7S35_10065 [Candidatus Limnocylindrales bacterium]|nr:hypothetical protein [Candidatus Limnocylindrales bacterium]